jgi:hypothetical protein
MDMEYRLLHLRQEYDELKALYSKTTRSMSVRRERHEVS